MKEFNYNSINSEQFFNRLADIINRDSASSLLDISGIYEILAEHFNNEVLESFEPAGYEDDDFETDEYEFEPNNEW